MFVMLELTSVHYVSFKFLFEYVNQLFSFSFHLVCSLGADHDHAGSVIPKLLPTPSLTCFLFPRSATQTCPALAIKTAGILELVRED